MSFLGKALALLVLTIPATSGGWVSPAATSRRQPLVRKLTSAIHKPAGAQPSEFRPRWKGRATGLSAVLQSDQDRPFNCIQASQQEEYQAVARLKQVVFALHLTSPYMKYQQVRLFQEALVDKTAVWMVCVPDSMDLLGSAECMQYTMVEPSVEDASVFDKSLNPFGFTSEAIQELRSRGVQPSEERALDIITELYANKPVVEEDAQRPGALWYISGVCVHPEARGQGIASTMMDTIEREARDNFGVDALFLHVEEDNVAAMKLYEGVGFTKLEATPEEVCFLDNPDLGKGQLMRKHLPVKAARPGFLRFFKAPFKYLGERNR